MSDGTPLPDWVVIERLRRQVADLQMQLDASCNAEELRIARAERDAAQAEAKRLREALEECRRVLEPFKGDYHNPEKASAFKEAHDALAATEPKEVQP